MADTGVEDFDNFYEDWQNRIDSFQGEKLSPARCRELREKMHDEFLALMMHDFSSRFTLEVDKEYRSLQSDLDAVLSKAESEYKLEQGKWYHYLPEKIRVEIQNLFGLTL